MDDYNKQHIQSTVKEKIVAEEAMQQALREMEEEGEPFTAGNLYSRASGWAFTTLRDCKQFLAEQSK